MWLVSFGGTHGQGDSLEEALADLERNLDTAKAEREVALASVQAERQKKRN